MCVSYHLHPETANKSHEKATLSRLASHQLSKPADKGPHNRLGGLNRVRFGRSSQKTHSVAEKILKKNWKLSSMKLIRRPKRTDVHDRQWSSKLIAAVDRLRREQLTHAWCHTCYYSFATRSTFSLVRAVFWPTITVLSFVAYPVTVHMSSLRLLIICGAQVAPFSLNLAIVRNIPSHNKQRCVIMAKFELKFGVMPISHPSSNFRLKQHRTLLNKCAKFVAKFFGRYQVITF